MSSSLLDTDTITLAQFGHATVVANLARHSIADVALSVISFQEQVRGVVGTSLPSNLRAPTGRLVRSARRPHVPDLASIYVALLS